MAFELWLLAPIFAAVSIFAGFYFSYYLSKQDSGTAKMKEISGWIREGAMAFLRREYTTLAYFVGGMAILLLVFLPAPIWSTANPSKNVQLALAYIFGAVLSALAGFVGMNMSTRANAKSANAARESLSKALTVGFRGGAVMGLMVVGSGLLGVSIVYWITKDPGMVL
ncbi:MAG: sodium/proton-translocating pyrophosphatase, partial [Dehalococcoidales bacterium]|nr:sodium/proton-translocating pyrophosphatase [Dehalococcoidales bacterium]